MKDDRSDGGKIARKLLGFPHEGNTEKRRMSVETKQLKSIRLTNVSSQNIARLSMASKRFVVATCRTRAESFQVRPVS